MRVRKRKERRYLAVSVGPAGNGLCSQAKPGTVQRIVAFQLDPEFTRAWQTGRP